MGENLSPRLGLPEVTIDPEGSVSEQVSPQKGKREATVIIWTVRLW